VPIQICIYRVLLSHVYVSRTKSQKHTRKFQDYSVLLDHVYSSYTKSQRQASSRINPTFNRIHVWSAAVSPAAAIAIAPHASKHDLNWFHIWSVAVTAAQQLYLPSLFLLSVPSCCDASKSHLLYTVQIVYQWAATTIWCRFGRVHNAKQTWRFGRVPSYGHCRQSWCLGSFHLDIDMRSIFTLYWIDLNAGRLVCCHYVLTTTKN
jgi:hypothetical protein